MLISTILGTGCDNIMGKGWRASSWFNWVCFDSSPDLARGYVETLAGWRSWCCAKICLWMYGWYCSICFSSSPPHSVTWSAKLQGRRFTRLFSLDSLRHPDPTWCDQVARANGSTVNVSRILVWGMWVTWVCLVCWHSVGLTWGEVWWSIRWIGVSFVAFGHRHVWQ